MARHLSPGAAGPAGTARGAAVAACACPSAPRTRLGSAGGAGRSLAHLEVTSTAGDCMTAAAAGGRTGARSRDPAAPTSLRPRSALLEPRRLSAAPWRP